MATANERRQLGFTLIEALVVVSILGTMVLVTVPNIRGSYESYITKSNARSLASVLKLGRMRAVTNNVPCVAELNSTMAQYCTGRSAGTETDSMTIYREDQALDSNQKVQCFSAKKGIEIQAVAAGTPNDKVEFRPTGMAASLAPNYFLILSRNKRECVLVCINAAGIVRVNPLQDARFGPSATVCTTPPYGATDSTPCRNTPQWW